MEFTPVRNLTLSLLSASFFRKKYEPFLLENASNLTHEILYDNFNKKIYSVWTDVHTLSFITYLKCYLTLSLLSTSFFREKNLFSICRTKTYVLNLMHFQGEMVNFLLNNEKRKC